MPKTPDDAIASMIANYEKNTGKPFDTWVALMRKEKLAKHGEIVKQLKDKHRMSHGYANLVATHVLRGDASAGGSDAIAAQYAGTKAALRPIYDKLATAVGKFGSDVELSPKKAYVSLRRSKQFGLIQPSTTDRLDIGITLKGVAPKGRLEASSSFSAMVTHRVRVASLKEVDAELVGWLKAAYDKA